MGNSIHRQDDSRSCGATTNVIGQSTVNAGGKLVAVNGDPNTHGDGQLIAATNNVYAGGIMVVNVGDNAQADNADHSNPSASSGLDSVQVGDPVI